MKNKQKQPMLFPEIPQNELITEIINLNAILNLPKGTEHFISDIHGEYDAFQHVLRNASGSIKEKIHFVFGEQLTTKEQNDLAFLIYYPTETIQKEQDTLKTSSQKKQWYQTTIKRLIRLIQFVSTKYTRSKVRKALPKEFAYIAEELLYQETNNPNKEDYYSEIVEEIIKLKQAPKLIIGLAETIRQLVVDHLHIVGDIYDRGPYPDKIIETLMTHHSLDIQWGNHDITWIGAASGSPIQIMNVLRISARYNNLSLVEDVYGINLRPLATFASKHYQDNPEFRPKLEDKQSLREAESIQLSQIQQATAIIQFKLESQLIARRPEFLMEHRQLLHMIDYAEQTITLKGKTYPLTHTCFQTIDPKNPNRLTEEEEELIQQLLVAFRRSEKLQRHMRFLVDRGQMYLRYNNNLLIHGCIPLTEDGQFKSLTIGGVERQGRQLLDYFEWALRECFEHPTEQQDLATDLIWYLWCGESSSLFGKNEMTTFERYFIQDKHTHKEAKNAYYQLRNDKQICENILNEFSLQSQDGHIINGHTPVKEVDGENPIKAGGKMLVIDGGFSKPYQKTTGIAGYTLIYNSFGMQLVAHQPFISKQEAIEQQRDIVSSKRVVDRVLQRKKVKDTTIGEQLLAELSQLNVLLAESSQRK